MQDLRDMLQATEAQLAHARQQAQAQVETAENTKEATMQTVQPLLDEVMARVEVWEQVSQDALKKAKRSHEETAVLLSVTQANSKAAKITKDKLQALADQAGLTMPGPQNKTLEQIYRDEDVEIYQEGGGTNVPADDAAAPVATAATGGRPSTMGDQVNDGVTAQTPAAPDPDALFVQKTDPEWVWTTPRAQNFHMDEWSRYITDVYHEAKAIFAERRRESLTESVSYKSIAQKAVQIMLYGRPARPVGGRR